MRAGHKETSRGEGEHLLVCDLQSTGGVKVGAVSMRRTEPEAPERHVQRPCAGVGRLRKPERRQGG